MKFNFYHGTSDIFLKSIQEHGLGGVNPNFAWKHLDTLKFLFNLAEIHLTEDLDYLVLRDSTKAMVLQSKLEIEINGEKELLNFRHDGIYISLSLERAVCYATRDAFGEIVSCAIRLMELLDRKNINYSNNELAIEKFQSFRKINPKPIIVKILHVDEDELDKEDGKTAKEALDLLRRIDHTLTKKKKFEFYQFCNFKLTETVLNVNLELYYLDYQGSYGKPDFEFTLTKIR